MQNEFCLRLHDAWRGVAAWLMLALASAVPGANVRITDGAVYEGEVFLEAGNTISVTLKDSSRKSIPLNQVRSATFASGLTAMANFGQFAEGWTNADIGEVTIAGVAGQSNSLFAAQVGSGDIGKRADSLNYTWFRAAGDADLVARVVSISGADRLARAGVMFRDSLRPEAKFAFIGVNAAGDIAVQQRGETGGEATMAATRAQATLPCWLKISRRENAFTVYRSADGKLWERLGGGTLHLKETFYAGLAVSSHSALAFCTALIDSVGRTTPGVRAEYFADAEFGQLVTNRIEPSINFQWGAEPPLERLPNLFSARWTGELEPKFSEYYTFFVDGEGAELWVNDQPLPRVPFKREGRAARNEPAVDALPILLKAGNRYPFRLEYRHNASRALVRLGWSSPGEGKGIIPARRLFSSFEARAQPGQRPGLTNRWVMGRGILLRNGTFIAGAIRSINADGAKFTYRGEKEHSVPLHQVSRAVFRVSPRNALLSNPELASGALLGNGDFVEGTLQFGRGRDVKVSSVLFGLRNYNVQSSDLAALVLNAPTATRVGHEVRLADNSILMAKSISVGPEQVVIVEPLLGELHVPRDAVTEIHARDRVSRPSAVR